MATLEEVLETGKPIATSYGMIRYFQMSEDKVIQKLAENVKEYYNLDDAFGEVGSNDLIAFGSNSYLYHNINKRFTNKYEKSIYCNMLRFLSLNVSIT